MEDFIFDRLLNVHSLKAIGVALGSFGLLRSDQVDALINGSGGDTAVIAIGLAAIVIAGLLRKA